MAVSKCVRERCSAADNDGGYSYLFHRRGSVFSSSSIGTGSTTVDPDTVTSAINSATYTNTFDPAATTSMASK